MFPNSKVNPVVISALPVSLFAFFAAIVAALVFRSGHLMMLGVLALPFLLIVSFTWPFVFPIGLYAFLIPFDAVMVVISGSTGGPTYISLLRALCIFVLLIKGLAEKRLHRPGAAAIYWIIFIGWCALSAVWAMNESTPDFLMRMTGAIGLLALYFALSVYPVNEKEYEFFKKSIMYGGLVAALYTIYLYYFGGLDLVETNRRTTMAASDMVDDPNQFAFSLLMPAAIGFYYLLKARKNRHRFFYLLALAAMSYGIVLSGSRGALIGMIVIAVTLLLFAPRKGLVLFAMTAITVTVLALAPENFFQRLNEASEFHGAGRDRVDIWLVGIDTFKHHWSLGVGLDNFENAYNYYIYDVPGAKFMGFSRAPHNLFLKVGVELGVVGLCLLLFAMIKHFMLLWKDRRRPLEVALLMACLLGLLAHSMTLDVIWRKPFWLVWTLIMMYDNLSKETGVEPDSPITHVP